MNTILQQLLRDAYGELITEATVQALWQRIVEKLDCLAPPADPAH